MKLHNEKKQVYIQIGAPFNVGAYVSAGEIVDVTASPAPQSDRKKAYSLRVFSGGLSLDTIRNLIDKLRHGN